MNCSLVAWHCVLLHSRQSSDSRQSLRAARSELLHLLTLLVVVFLCKLARTSAVFTFFKAPHFSYVYVSLCVRNTCQLLTTRTLFEPVASKCFCFHCEKV